MLMGKRKIFVSDRCHKTERGHSHVDIHIHSIMPYLFEVLFIILLMTLKCTIRKHAIHRIKLAKMPVWTGEGPRKCHFMAKELLAKDSCLRRKSHFFFKDATPDRLFMLQ